MTDPSIPIAYGTPISSPMVIMQPPAATAPVVHGDEDDLHNKKTILKGAGTSTRVLLPPSASTTTNQSSNSNSLSENATRVLLEQGYTRGLIAALGVNKVAFPLSIWIVDNSGSMATRDGHRLLDNGNSSNVKFVECTRWAEMQQTVDYHAQMACTLQSPTVFRMLNDPGRHAGPQQFSIAEKGMEQSQLDADLALAQSTMMNAAPGGVTPLVSHVQEIRQNVLALEPSLRSSGAKVVLVLATDGLPTDVRGVTNASVQRQFTEALRSLEGLPVWVVVRLCTDDDEVVEYWNDLDEQLELSLEVLDDYLSEAQEVYEQNKWLNYGLPLHRMRELGFYSRLFDMLDERPLAKDELREFFRLLFRDMDGVPDPQADWKAFTGAVERLVQQEKKTWNPIRKRMEPWIDMRALNRQYGPGFFASMFR